MLRHWGTIALRYFTVSCCEGMSTPDTVRIFVPALKTYLTFVFTAVLGVANWFSPYIVRHLHRIVAV